jgi:Protein of unknown function (DUF3634)
MTEIVTQLVILAAAVGVVFVIAQAAFAARFQFMVKIKRGEPRVVKGKVTIEFLDEIRATCREYGVAAGWIGGMRRGKTIALRFSNNFPPDCQQRLRNTWFSR